MRNSTGPTAAGTSTSSESSSPDSPDQPPYPPVFHPSEGALVVRAEEALIVLLVLVLWVGAIILFFNRWGKIRMLEPYQPKFHQEHRASCPMAEMTSINQHRTSFSKYNVSCMDTPGFGMVGPSYRSLLRPRQNSVFVGSTITVKVNPPRKTKSAMDLHALVRREPSPGLTRSMQPLNAERRPSCIALNRSRRPSHLSDLLPPGAFTQSRERRPSFNSVLAQVTAERRPSSSMLRISNV